MKSILEKEQAYRDQMVPVLGKVLRFAQSKGWSRTMRGRRANACIHGPVNGLEGVIDIIMMETDWEKAPDALTGDTPMSLWSSAFQDRDELRFTVNLELYWEVPFGDLLRYTEPFLTAAWDMLQSMRTSDLVLEKNGPLPEPWRPPDFGPPVRRGA